MSGLDWSSSTVAILICLLSVPSFFRIGTPKISFIGTLRCPRSSPVRTSSEYLACFPFLPFSFVYVLRNFRTSGVYKNFEGIMLRLSVGGRRDINRKQNRSSIDRLNESISCDCQKMSEVKIIVALDVSMKIEDVCIISAARWIPRRNALSF